MKKTKKVKSMGRYGARYGIGIRKRMLKIEPKQRKKHICPHCGFERVKRISTGIYFCTKCEKEFAGGAYIPQTMAGNIISKMVAQKSFVPHIEELISLKDEKEKEELERAEKEKAELSVKAERIPERREEKINEKEIEKPEEKEREIQKREKHKEKEKKEEKQKKKLFERVKLALPKFKRKEKGKEK